MKTMKHPPAPREIVVALVLFTKYLGILQNRPARYAEKFNRRRAGYVSESV